MVEIIDLLQGAPVPYPEAPLSLAMGNFDGVHLGHRALIAEAVAVAAAERMLPAVWSFDRNPSGAPELSSVDEKAEICAALGARYLIRCPFDEVRRTDAEDFLRGLLIGRLGVRAAVCGFNHRFGKNGAGTPDLLGRVMEEIGGLCRIVRAVELDGSPISSSRIRAALAEGDVESANVMLGRRYSLSAPGVYVTECMGIRSVTNVGRRPTVTDSGEPVLETHIIGYEGDLYGQTLEVAFLRRIRPEIKFASLGELADQLKRDVEFAVNFKE